MNKAESVENLFAKKGYHVTPISETDLSNSEMQAKLLNILGNLSEKYIEEDLKNWGFDADGNPIMLNH